MKQIADKIQLLSKFHNTPEVASQNYAFPELVKTVCCHSPYQVWIDILSGLLNIPRNDTLRSKNLKTFLEECP